MQWYASEPQDMDSTFFKIVYTDQGEEAVSSGLLVHLCPLPPLAYPASE